jgi:C4-dicarboxylate transporter DctM subunit
MITVILPILLVILVLLLLIAGVEIAVVLGFVGLMGLLYYRGFDSLVIFGNITWSHSAEFTLLAVPLFILMGTILMHSGVSRKLYDTLVNWLHWLPGNLAIATIVGCGIFAALSGSSTATAATIGMVAIPEMLRWGYDRRLVAGVVAAGGTIGVLIPPSVPMIIYGSMLDQSVGQLFTAGIIPGILMTLLFVVYILFVSSFHPMLAPKVEIQVTWGERLRSLLNLIPLLILMFLVIGTIYSGVATPTESAAIGALGSILIAWMNKSLTLSMFKKALLDTVSVTGMIMFIVLGALVLSSVITFLKVPQSIAILLNTLQLSPWMTFVIVCFVYVVLGVFLEAIAMLAITLPILGVMMLMLGFDGIWLGIVLVVLIEMGLITPPVGMNLFVVQGTMKDIDFADLVRGVLPFILIIVLMVILLTLFPDLALWLPNLK